MCSRVAHPKAHPTQATGGLRKERANLKAVRKRDIVRGRDDHTHGQSAHSLLLALTLCPLTLRRALAALLCGSTWHGVCRYTTSVCMCTPQVASMMTALHMQLRPKFMVLNCHCLGLAALEPAGRWRDNSNCTHPP